MIISNALFVSLIASALSLPPAHASRSSFHSSHARRSLHVKKTSLADLHYHRDLGDALRECPLFLSMLSSCLSRASCSRRLPPSTDVLAGVGLPIMRRELPGGLEGNILPGARATIHRPLRSRNCWVRSCNMPSSWPQQRFCLHRRWHAAAGTIATSACDDRPDAMRDSPVAIGCLSPSLISSCVYIARSLACFLATGCLR